MPLYGGGGDVAACAAAVTLAVTTGVARIVNDRHWATDVSLAWVVGGLASYGWPKWFHYRSRATVSSDTTQLTFLPMVAPGQVSGTWLGMF